MKAAGVLLAIAAAIVLQVTLARFVARSTGAVDLVLVVVVYVALTSGAAAGLLSGALAGIVEDAFLSSSGIVGIGGLAKTIVGFLVGIAGTQFILAQPFPRFVVFFGATFLHAAVFIGLYVLLDLRQLGTPYAWVTGQAVGNAVVGVVAFQLAELMPGAMERHRASKGRLHR